MALTRSSLFVLSSDDLFITKQDYNLHLPAKPRLPARQCPWPPRLARLAGVGRRGLSDCLIEIKKSLPYGFGVHKTAIGVITPSPPSTYGSVVP